MARVRQADTAPELKLRSKLHRIGLRFRKNRRPIGSLRRSADVVFTRGKVAVFVDGCFWHGCSKHFSLPKSNADWWERKIRQNIERDRETDRLLGMAGWVVVRVWEHEDLARAAERIRDLVLARRR